MQSGADTRLWNRVAPDSGGNEVSQAKDSLALKKMLLFLFFFFSFSFSFVNSGKG